MLWMLQWNWNWTSATVHLHERYRLRAIETSTVTTGMQLEWTRCARRVIRALFCRFHLYRASCQIIMSKSCTQCSVYDNNIISATVFLRSGSILPSLNGCHDICIQCSMGVKFGLALWRMNKDWGCFRTKCWEKYFNDDKRRSQLSENVIKWGKRRRGPFWHSWRNRVKPWIHSQAKVKARL
jgi:hypothetical protein